jgi:hypothetical protein
MSNFDVIDIEEDEFTTFYSDKMKTIKKKKFEKMEPTENEMSQVYEIILKYVKDKKRKIYGGYGWNKLFTNKDKKYAIYDKHDVPDIDFYSPEPITDLIALCDILHEKGFKYINGKEAQHGETYSIFVNFQLYCEMSYMPKNIYNKVRFIIIDGLNITHPWFMMIDFFRMLTDPMLSWWRFEKHFERYLKLQKLYPLPKTNKPLMIERYDDKNIEKTITKIMDIICEKNNIIVTGFYAYNYYVYLTKEKGTDKYVNIPFIEAYTDEYNTDGMDLIESITKLSDKITHSEFYPFFQLYEYNCVFYYDGTPIFYLYSNSKKCLPYKQVDYIKFENKQAIVNNKRKINIASFDLNILQALIILVKVRIDDDGAWNDILYKLINGFVNLRNLYLKQNKLKSYDDSIVGSFVTDCIGKTITPEREKGLLIQSRIKKKKALIIRYIPGEKSHNFSNYVFPNSSGNKIINDRNLKLSHKTNNESDDENNDDDDENNSEDNSNNKKNKYKNKHDKKYNTESTQTSDDFEEEEEDLTNGDPDISELLNA